MIREAALLSEEPIDLDTVTLAIDGMRLSCAESVVGIVVTDESGAVVLTAIPSAAKWVPASVSRVFGSLPSDWVDGRRWLTELVWHEATDHSARTVLRAIAGSANADTIRGATNVA